MCTCASSISLTNNMQNIFLQLNVTSFVCKLQLQAIRWALFSKANRGRVKATVHELIASCGTAPI